MGRNSLEVRAIAFAFLWLWISESGFASKREDLERAAELAVERAAERAAERAVEKALESGNSTTESETIRESYSSVRKYDKTLKLPGTGYTPAQRHEYDRIVREREAAERASAVLKRSTLLKRSVDKGRRDARQLVPVVADQAAQHQHQRQYYQHLPAVASGTTSPYHVTRQLPFPVGHYDATIATDADRQSNPPVLSSGRAHPARGHETGGPSLYPVRKVPSFYPVKIFTIQSIHPQQLYHLVPVAPSETASSGIHQYHNNRRSWVEKSQNRPLDEEDGPRRSWIHP